MQARTMFKAYKRAKSKMEMAASSRRSVSGIAVHRDYHALSYQRWSQLAKKIELRFDGIPHCPLCSYPYWDGERTEDHFFNCPKHKDNVNAPINVKVVTLEPIYFGCNEVEVERMKEPFEDLDTCARRLGYEVTGPYHQRFCIPAGTRGTILRLREFPGVFLRHVVFPEFRILYYNAWRFVDKNVEKKLKILED